MWAILLGTLAGVALGTVSGLVPGIHANTMAGILLALDAALIPILGVEPLAAAMFAALIAHSFLDIVPSTFLGVPDADTAIAVLPAHALCLAGEGIQAVRLSALGSALGVAIAVPLSLVFSLVLPLAQPFLDWGIGILLIAVAGYLIVVSEAPGWSFGVFIASGALGVFAFQNAHLSWNTVGDMTILMPLLSGLFGLSVLLFSTSAPIPEQRHTPIPLGDREIGRISLMGTIAGALVGWLPGLSNATANALLAPVVGYDSDGRSYIVATSAANTANAILGLSALYAIARTRNGVMVAIASHDLPPFWLLLFCGVLAACIAYLLTLRLSRHAVWLNGLNARRLNFGVIGVIAILSLALCGPFGLFVLILATAIGVAPPLANVRRVFCMGAVMLPIILQSLGFGFL
ncbi:MAG: tripartite tricarboxylate transporter permease [Methanomicrobiales archaeon]|nr:tripartite tricarboxylate transporter permease [Methanomicrobiales archaeon]MDI6875646.1 tripartite tricarboxylate transporter permease [Methanomicrobiales archaeon]